ncbi:MAG: GIY-YIG nuclease family protein [bacterium]
MKTKKSKVWYVYGVRCSDSTLYVGITNNLKARIEKHNKGTGAKYTRSRRPVKLLRSEKCGDIGTAMRREKELKRIGKVKKELWVGNRKNISHGLTRIKTRTKTGIKGEYKRQKIKSKRILATDKKHGLTRKTENKKFLQGLEETFKRKKKFNRE